MARTEWDPQDLFCEGTGEDEHLCNEEEPQSLHEGHMLPLQASLSPQSTHWLLWNNTVPAKCASSSSRSWQTTDRLSSSLPLACHPKIHYPVHHSSSPFYHSLTCGAVSSQGQGLLSLSCTKTWGWWLTWEWHGNRDGRCFKIVANHISDKGRASRIHKEFWKLDSKKTKQSN